MTVGYLEPHGAISLTLVGGNADELNYGIASRLGAGTEDSSR